LEKGLPQADMTIDQVFIQKSRRLRLMDDEKSQCFSTFGGRIRAKVIAWLDIGYKMFWNLRSSSSYNH
jgi:hypothetical protein